MKNSFKEKSSSLLKKVCERTAMQQLDTTCVFYLHETKMPNALLNKMNKNLRCTV
jgi:cyclic lactone autoinducer peptide